VLGEGFFVNSPVSRKRAPVPPILIALKKFFRPGEGFVTAKVVVAPFPSIFVPFKQFF
jgi:hypothetical protein